jgi:hypothetical protein
MRRAISRELIAVQRRVERWRERQGGRGSRVPEELWNEAVGVARVEGVYATSQALRFNYKHLKDRLSRAEGKGRADGNGKSAFVALEMGQLCGGGKTVVELVGRGGEQMRIEVTGPVDLLGLSQAFWSRRS